MSVLQELYDSEINFQISCFWDGRFEVALGDQSNGFKESKSFDTVDECLYWLESAAVRWFPESCFAKKRREKSICVWTPRDVDLWRPSCKSDVWMATLNPNDAGVVYCPYCGNSIDIQYVGDLTTKGELLS